MNRLYLGIDVGTGSARAGIFNSKGKMISSRSCGIQIWKYEGDYVEQSSENIWNAICTAVRDAVNSADIQPSRVKGIAFDATCSLVAVDNKGQPVAVNREGEDNRNVIVWMDHRSIEQAERINSTGHRVLKYVGGKISPEMQIPKLLWLKENNPECWKRSDRFFDLPDYLSYRASGALERSQCTTVCKWTYLGHETNGWDSSFFDQIGIPELLENNAEKIGENIVQLGNSIGNGLSKQAAEDLGLNEGTPVGVSIIDAHAGGIGLLGININGNPLDESNAETRLALIGGTSSCHMICSTQERHVSGVWGPYFSAMLPGYWLTEGGQSATGALLDHIIFSSSLADGLERQAKSSGTSVYQLLNEKLEQMTGGASGIPYLTKDLHILPYFHGNRSPRADAQLTGMISGLQLDNSLEALARTYLATLQAVALGTRHIIEELNKAGYRVNTIFATGGGIKNSLFLKAHADICGCDIVLPEEPESVLLGSAILASVAAGEYSSIPAAMAEMSRPGSIIRYDTALAGYYEAKYRIFKEMYNDQMKYKSLMTREI